MKSETGNKMKLGILIVAGIVLFILSIYFIGKKQQLFNKTIQISSIFKDVNGLQVGNNVRFSGINVGVIESITQITDTTVAVRMQVNQNVQVFIKTNVKAIIGSDGLMGNKIMQLIPSTPGMPPIANNAYVASTQSVSIDDILIKIKTTSDNSANITTDLAFIMHNIREGNGTIGKLLSDKKFAKNIDDAIVNIKQGAGGFKQNMNAAQHNFFLRGFFKKKNKDKTTSH